MVLQSQFLNFLRLKILKNKLGLNHLKPPQRRQLKKLQQRLMQLKKQPPTKQLKKTLLNLLKKLQNLFMILQSHLEMLQNHLRAIHNLFMMLKILWDRSWMFLNHLKIQLKNLMLRLNGESTQNYTSILPHVRHFYYCILF